MSERYGFGWVDPREVFTFITGGGGAGGAGGTASYGGSGGGAGVYPGVGGRAGPMIDLKDIKVVHESGDREFRIRVSYLATRELAESCPNYKLVIIPIVRNVFAKELDKETRPYSWRKPPAEDWRPEFDVDGETMIIVCRGQYNQPKERGGLLDVDQGELTRVRPSSPDLEL